MHAAWSSLNVRLPRHQPRDSLKQDKNCWQSSSGNRKPREFSGASLSRLYSYEFVPTLWSDLFMTFPCAQLDVKNVEVRCVYHHQYVHTNWVIVDKGYISFARYVEWMKRICTSNGEQKFRRCRSCIFNSFLNWWHSTRARFEIKKNYITCIIT